MKTLVHLIPLLLVVQLFPSCVEQQEEHHVIIVSIDGFPARALWNDDVSLPVLREMAEEGAWADAMIVSTPSVTWPNHTSLVTGTHPDRHHLLFNGLVIRDQESGTVRTDNDRDRDELLNPEVQTLYDVAHEAGLGTAEVNWPATRNAETLHDRFPDAPYRGQAMNRELQNEMLEMGWFDEEDMEAYWIGNDEIWTQTASHILRERQPNLLLLHLLNVDSTHHRYGPDTHAGNTAMSYADKLVGDLLRTLDEIGIRDQSTVFIVSDHGFVSVEHRIHPNRLFRQAGLLETDDDGSIDRARVQSLSLAGGAMVYATDPDTREEDIAEAYELLQDVEGIYRIFTPDEYADIGLPHPDDTDQVGDLFLAAESQPGYAFSNSAVGDEIITEQETPSGSHGYLATLPLLETVFVAYGRGIEPGSHVEEVDNRSIAVTAAHLLGLELETADGEVLLEILSR